MVPWRSYYELAADNLGKIGINVELKPEEYGKYISTTALGKYEKMAMGPSTPFTEVDDFLYGRFYPELPTNQSRVADAELTKMLLAQRREMDPKKRKQIVDDIQRYLADKAYYVYVPQWPQYVAHPPYVKGFKHHDGYGLGMRLVYTWLDDRRDLARAAAHAVKQYVLRRLALAIPTLFLVSVIVFALMRLMPGDVATRMVEGHAYAPTLDALRHDLGLDRPVHVQYLEWIGGIVLRGDFGRSYWTRQPILDEFVRRFPVTLELALLTILVSVVHRGPGGHRLRGAPGLGLRLRGPDPGHPGAVRAVLRPRGAGGGAAVDLLQVDAGVDLRALHRRPAREPQDHDRARARVRGDPGRPDHAHHALGAARRAAPGLHPHRVVQGAARSGPSCCATRSRTR